MNETENNRIREALEQIEPAEGARERMLANIRRKAAQASENESAPSAINPSATQADTTVSGELRDTAKNETAPNRRITAILRWAVPAAACLIIVIIGAVQLFPRNNKPSTSGDVTATVTATVTPDGGTATFGPLTVYSSAEELAAATGMHIDAPAGATDVSYEAAGTDFAQVLFTYGGREYTLRASESSEDFSGLYGEESQPRQLESVDDAVVTFVKDEGTDFFKLVWNEGSVKNILSGPGDTTDLDIAEVYRKLRGK